MKSKLFQYTHGYGFTEYKSICEKFKNIKLKFAHEFMINGLLASYIFGYITNRFQTKVPNIFKRFLGSFFVYPIKMEEHGSKTAILFTGPDRIDYWQNVHSVAREGKNISIISLDRTKPKIRFQNFFCLVKEVIWAFQLNSIVHNMKISFDMAISVYRTIVQAKYIDIYIEKRNIKNIICFCDQWECENAVVQLVSKKGGVTATLQHGNGTEIFYPVPSRYFLSNSKLSAERAIKLGLPAEKIIVAEPMKFIGKQFKFSSPYVFQNIGVVLDGGFSYESNSKMIVWVEELAKKHQITCTLKFHPSTNIDEYVAIIDKDTRVERYQQLFLNETGYFYLLYFYILSGINL